MVRPIRALMYGVGAVARGQMVRLMKEKGVEIVGAVSRSRDVGRDLGQVCGLGRPLGVLISDDPLIAVAGRSIDIAVHAVTNSLAGSFDQIAVCVNNGINVLTIGTQAINPWGAAPDLAKALDRMARENKVTIAASGFQDVYWINMIIHLAGTSHTIESIQGTARFNINEFGPEVARSYFVGDAVEDFRRSIGKNGPPANTLRYCAERICAAMDLTVQTVSEACEPVIAESDVECTSLSTTVPAGRLIGCTGICDLKTVEGVGLQVRYIRKCYQPGEKDINRWIIHGRPDITIENIDPPTAVATASTTVNRIPDVINAEPGFVTGDQLPQLRYRPLPLHHYVHAALDA